MSKEPNNPTVVATENPSGPKGCSTNFTTMEDLMVIMAYFQASEDSISGAKQKGHIFKSAIESIYKSILVEQEEKEAHDATNPLSLHEMYGVDTVSYPRCTGHLVHMLCSKYISPCICKFIAIQHANQLHLGEDLATYKMHLLTIYKDKHGSDIKFYCFFTFVKDNPKFMLLLQADNNQPVIGDEKCRKGIGSSSNHPIGMKKAKKEQQENDMSDQMAKKFGVTSTNSISSGATCGASPKCGQSLSKLLDKAGEGMTAWLMQSAMASASAEKKQALADGMIDDHLHQLQAKKQQQAMATLINAHDVPMEIMMLPMTTDTLNVQEDDRN